MSSRPHLRPVDEHTELPPGDPPGPVGPHRYLLISQADGHRDWLGRALWDQGSVVPVSVDDPPSLLTAQIARHRPQAVLVDFCGHTPAVQAMPKELARQWPELPLIGVGRAAEPAALLAALRAGVHDFVDLDASPAEAQAIVAAVLARRPAVSHATQGHTVALLGARSGLGVSTLAASLALLLQDALVAVESKVRRLPVNAGAAPAPDEPAQGVALLDLGLPVRDSLMYLDSESEFSFVDGVRNLRRLDRTLAQSAFARHDSGVAVLPLPAVLTQMREVSHADAVSLIERLSDFYDMRIIDLGGFAPVEFVAQVAKTADRVWVVCDQSLGGVVSTAALLRDLASRGLGADRLGLVVNQYDAQAGLMPQDIAQRLGVPLAHVVPARRAALLAAASRGEMLVSCARSDAYTQAVQAMARSLQQQGEGTPEAAPRSPWQSLKGRFSSRRTSA